MLLVAAPAAPAISPENLLAPLDYCEGQLDAEASRRKQAKTMRCMVNYARVRARRDKLNRVRLLDTSARHKAKDVLRCQMFDHNACGRDFLYWFHETGYTRGCWHAGENLAWGNGPYADVRSMMGQWLRSPEHRENLLDESFTGFGVGFAVGRFGEYRDAHVWALHLGSHSCSSAAGRASPDYQRTGSVFSWLMNGDIT